MASEPFDPPTLPWACGACGAGYYGEGAARGCCGGDGGAETTPVEASVVPTADPAKDNALVETVREARGAGRRTRAACLTFRRDGFIVGRSVLPPSRSVEYPEGVDEIVVEDVTRITADEPTDGLDEAPVREAMHLLKNVLHYWDAPAGPVTTGALKRAQDLLDDALPEYDDDTAIEDYLEDSP